MDQVFMIVGFAIAAYSVVANDAIQTLGTFLSSNSRRPWWVLWAYAGSILAAVLCYGFFVEGNVAYGRLEKYPLPDPFAWFYIVPPLVLLFLTRFGIPVSTTFLILTIFNQKNLTDTLIKSGAGYLVAIVAALLLYSAAIGVERRFLATADKPPAPYWTALQWTSTGFLWSRWLIQDLANVFVYLPRDLELTWFLAALVLMLLIQMYTFYTQGGEIQKIVTSKTNTDDIRSATIIDFLFGAILLVFEEWSKVPMSTTWVFLGLLAGREIILTLRLQPRTMQETLTIVGTDAAKATGGIVVSVIIAVGLPWLAGMLG